MCSAQSVPYRAKAAVPASREKAPEAVSRGGYSLADQIHSRCPVEAGPGEQGVEPWCGAAVRMRAGLVPAARMTSSLPPAPCDTGGVLAAGSQVRLEETASEQLSPLSLSA